MNVISLFDAERRRRLAVELLERLCVRKTVAKRTGWRDLARTKCSQMRMSQATSPGRQRSRKHTSKAGVREGRTTNYKVTYLREHGLPPAEVRFPARAQRRKSDKNAQINQHQQNQAARERNTNDRSRTIRNCKVRATKMRNRRNRTESLHTGSRTARRPRPYRDQGQELTEQQRKR